jgi:DNA primase
MPGIDFVQVRARIALADVLDLIGFVPCETAGDQLRGPCPVHHSTAPSSRSFSANLRLYIYRCFKSGSSGIQLDLYTSVTGLSLFDAAVALCEQLHREVPWMLRETSLRSQPADHFTPELRSGRKPGGQAGSILGRH